MLMSMVIYQPGAIGFFSFDVKLLPNLKVGFDKLFESSCILVYTTTSANCFVSLCSTSLYNILAIYEILYIV